MFQNLKDSIANLLSHLNLATNVDVSSFFLPEIIQLRSISCDQALHILLGMTGSLDRATSLSKSSNLLSEHNHLIELALFLEAASVSCLKRFILFFLHPKYRIVLPTS